MNVPKLTTTTKGYLRWMVEHKKILSANVELNTFSCPEHFLLEKGKQYKLRSANRLRTRQTDPFKAAMEAAEMFGWDYVEGFAKNGHGAFVSTVWVVDNKGYVKVCSNGQYTDFFGVKIPLKTAKKSLEKTGVTGVLQNYIPATPYWKKPLTIA